MPLAAISSNAQSMGDQLARLPRLPPSEAMHHEAALSARSLLKKVSVEQKGDPRIARLTRELLAFKLGVPSEVFDQNPGFEKFASRPPLERYLAEYGHQVRVGDDGKVQLMHEGRYRPWNEIAEVVQRPAVINDPSAYQEWFYGPGGVQNKNTFEWAEPEPYKIEDPAQWDFKYIFEFCCCCEGEPRWVGDHSYFRLKTPEGQIYCFGLYRPYKQDPKRDARDPMRVQPGHLMSPDITEFYPTPIHRIPIEITRAQFEEMLRVITADKRENRQIFQLAGSNCTLYTAKIARIAGIALPTSKPAWRLLAPKLQKPVDWLSRWVPSILQKLAAKITAFVINIGFVFAGARLVDRRVTHLAPTPFIERIDDLFSVKKLNVDHPHTLGHSTKPKVLEWRAAAPGERRFALPDTMRLRVNPDPPQS